MGKADRQASSQALSMPRLFWLTTRVFLLNPNSGFPCSTLLLSPAENPCPEPFPAFHPPLEGPGSQGEHCSFSRCAAPQCREAWWVVTDCGSPWEGKPWALCLEPQVSGGPSLGRLGLGSLLFAAPCVTLACNQQRKYSLLPDCLPKTISIILAFQWMEKPSRLAQEITLKGSVN